MELGAIKNDGGRLLVNRKFVSRAAFGIEMFLLRKGVSQRWLHFSFAWYPNACFVSVCLHQRRLYLWPSCIFFPGMYLFQGNVGLTTHSQNLLCKEMGLLKELRARP